MMEVDLRRAGVGCVDNPVSILSSYLSKGKPLRILLREDQLSLVKEILDTVGYSILKEEKEEDYIVVETAPAENEE